MEMPILYDQFNRPIQGGFVKRPETREIASISIRDRWSGYPSNGLVPERLARIFKEADNGDMLRQAELFEEMEEKDAHLASQFQVRKLAVQGLAWEVTPRTEDRRAKDAATLCREFLDGFADFDEHILDLLDALAKGYSMMEILWDVSEGQSLIRNLRWIHPKKVTFWNSITPKVLTEKEPVRGIDPPPFKFVYHRYKARSGHDVRGGILRVCAWMYLFKNYAIKDWVAFAEVYGMPLRIGKYEPGASKADREALIQAVRSLGTDAAGIISKSTEIEFIESQKSSSLNIYESLSRFCDSQMSKAVLGQTLTSEAGGSKGSGSYALGKVHGDVRHDLTEADCRALGKTITQQILRPLVGFNLGWDTPVPRFNFLFEPPEDLKVAAETYRILAEMGFDLSQEHVSKRFKVPLRKQGEKPLTKSGPGQDRQSGGESGRESASQGRRIRVTDRGPELLFGRGDEEEYCCRFSADSRAVGGEGNLETPSADSGQEFIDEMADRMSAVQGVLDPLLREVIPIVQKARSFEEILESIYSKYHSLDTSTLQDLIHHAMFAANVWGYVRACEEAER